MTMRHMGTTQCQPLCSHLLASVRVLIEFLTNENRTIKDHLFKMAYKNQRKVRQY